jgi:hypothetical protein
MDEMPKGRGAKGKKEDEERPAEAEARAIDVKVKGAEDGGAILHGNLDLLKKMQEEQWKNFEWIDAEVSVRLCGGPSVSPLQQ